MCLATGYRPMLAHNLFERVNYLFSQVVGRGYRQPRAHTLFRKQTATPPGRRGPGLGVCYSQSSGNRFALNVQLML